MTSPAEEIVVECPDCKRWYEAWHRPSINRLIDNFSDEFIEKASTKICPYCNCKASLEFGSLVASNKSRLEFRKLDSYAKAIAPSTRSPSIALIQPAS